MISSVLIHQLSCSNRLDTSSCATVNGKKHRAAAAARKWSTTKLTGSNLLACGALIAHSCLSSVMDLKGGKSNHQIQRDTMVSFGIMLLQFSQVHIQNPHSQGSDLKSYNLSTAEEQMLSSAKQTWHTEGWPERDFPLWHLSLHT